MSAWTILACGDPMRGDDGAAIAALDRLDRVPGALPPDVVIRRVGELEPDDLVAATARGSCIVLDAVVGVEPGALVELPVDALGSADAPAPASSHALPLDVVVGVAEVLGADLGAATFLGIGGEDFELGHDLSDAVRDHLDAFASRIAWSILEEDPSPCA
jgi:hydrogenase maturation protease